MLERARRLRLRPDRVPADGVGWRTAPPGSDPTVLAGAGAGGEGVLFVNERVTVTLTLNQTVVSGNVPDNCLCQRP